MENSPVVSRKSRRREREAPRRGYLGDHDKPIKSATERHPSRTPLRYVPDLPGFEVLSKIEIKKDTREIEKATTMLPSYEPEVERDESLLLCSSKPPCPPESNIAKKRKRYIAWISGPDHIDQDLRKYRAALEQIKEEFSQISDDELQWNNTFLVMRAHLITQLNILQDESKKLRSEAKQLYSMSVEESGIQTRKRRAMHMRDVLNELQDRNLELISHITDHKKALADAANVPSLQWLAKPFKCEFGVDSLGFSRGHTVSTPYGKGTVESIRDNRDQRSGIVVGVKLAFGTAYLQHQQVTTARKLFAHAAPPTAEQPAMEISTQRLLGRFALIEERLRLAEANIGDLENFFPDEDDEDAGQDIDEDLVTHTPHDDEVAAAPYLLVDPDRDEGYWLHELEERAGKQQPRRKRRVINAVDCQTTMLPRTPYNIPLLLSPLSQVPDKYLGALYGGQALPEKIANSMHVPDQLSSAENIMFENQNLRANLARAKVLLRRLENAKDDWQKQLDESDKTLTRTRAMFQALEVESEALSAQQRRDLAVWEISKLASSQDVENGALTSSRLEAAKNGRNQASQKANARNRKSRGGRTSRGDGVSLSQESVSSIGAEGMELEVPAAAEATSPKQPASETEALAVGALAALGAVVDDENDEKGQKRRVIRRRNPQKK